MVRYKKNPTAKNINDKSFELLLIKYPKKITVEFNDKKTVAVII